MSENKIQKSNTISILSRKQISITGVNDIINFDESSILLSTECGKLIIEGNNLQITTLDVDSGNLVVQGTVNSVYYNESEKDNKHGLLTRIFK